MNADLNNVFKKPPENPFSLCLSLNLKDSKTEGLYEYIKNFYIRGLGILINNDTSNKPIIITNIHKKYIDLMHKYMLSFGIETYYHRYTSTELDLLFRDFLYVIEKIENIEIKVILNWKKREIQQIAMKLDKLNNNECKYFWEVSQKYNKVNMFFKFYTPTRLKDFGFKVKDKDVTYLVYFDFADRAKYERKTDKF